MSIVLPDSSDLLFQPTVRLQKGQSFNATAVCYRNGEQSICNERNRDSSVVKFYQKDHRNSRMNINKRTLLTVRLNDEFGKE